jgi:23S rRNA (guanosine2251-2'-O)-methyltransferase
LGIGMKGSSGSGKGAGPGGARARREGRPFQPRRPIRPPPTGQRTDRDDGLQVIYGIHSVVEALGNPRRVIKTLVATENGALRLRQALPALDREPVIVEPEAISRQVAADAVHQGVLLIAEPLEPATAEALGEARLLLALDQVTDPHNVGAILRSAAAFGVEGLIVTERHSAALTGALAKAASGALEHVPIVYAKNLSQTLADLKARGVLTLGLDSDAEGDLETFATRLPLCLVLGAEGKGLRAKTRETVDHLVRLEMRGAIRSLNVSNAAAVALYAATRSALPKA